MPFVHRTAVVILHGLATSGLLAGQTTRIRDGTGRERVCERAQLPDRLLSVAEVLDTAGLAAQVRGVTSGVDSDSYVFSLLFTESQTAPTVRLLEPAVDGSPLADAVRATVQPQERLGLWGLRLRVRPGPPLSLALERSVYCPPALDTASRQGASPDAAFGLRPDLPPAWSGRASQRTRLEAKVTLSETGAVVRIDLTRRSGIKRLDDWFVSGVQATTYLPALLDGLPIPSWYRTNGTWLRL